MLALAALFAFRVFYGLTMPFWFEDERQVYLVGLQSFVRGEWPYFGADVVWTGAQVPGALLGWLIRLPLAIWSAPESPIVFLNVLSFSALGLLAWYLSRRLPGVPTWLIWLSLLTLPWTLNFSTHIVNPSYVLAAGAIFFVGFFEATPVLTHRIVPSGLAWSMMGAGLLSMMQLHMSWVLLVPYARCRDGLARLRTDGARGSRAAGVARAAAAFVAGAAIPASLLVPTIFKYGWGAGGVEDAIVLRAQSPFAIVTTVARVLSFASFEINRFVGLSTAERVLALLRQPLMIVAAVPVAIAGVVQPAVDGGVGVPRIRSQARRMSADWTRVRCWCWRPSRSSRQLLLLDTRPASALVLRRVSRVGAVCVHLLERAGPRAGRPAPRTRARRGRRPRCRHPVSPVRWRSTACRGSRCTWTGPWLPPLSTIGTIGISATDGTPPTRRRIALHGPPTPWSRMRTAPRLRRASCS